MARQLAVEREKEMLMRMPLAKQKKAIEADLRRSVVTKKVKAAIPKPDLSRAKSIPERARMLEQWEAQVKREVANRMHEFCVRELDLESVASRIKMSGE